MAQTYEARKDYFRRYYQKNKERMKAYQREYNREYRKQFLSSDPNRVERRKMAQQQDAHLDDQTTGS